MRLYEVANSTPARIDELNMKHAVAGGALALATQLGTPDHPVAPQIMATPSTYATNTQSAKLKKYTDIITKVYKVEPDLANRIVKLAKKHEKPGFPKAEDILALIGIESSFNPDAVSNLKTDPAVGLTQIRPNAWGLNPQHISKNIEAQISNTANILSRFDNKLKNQDNAIQSYNIGLTAFLRGDQSLQYLRKFKKEKELFTGDL